MKNSMFGAVVSRKLCDARALDAAPCALAGIASAARQARAARAARRAEPPPDTASPSRSSRFSASMLHVGGHAEQLVDQRRRPAAALRCACPSSTSTRHACRRRDAEALGEAVGEQHAARRRQRHRRSSGVEHAPQLAVGGSAGERGAVVAMAGAQAHRDRAQRLRRAHARQPRELAQRAAVDAARRS